MKVETIYEKGAGQVNEDAMLLANPIFGVFDGAFDPEEYKDERGRTGATIASSIAREVFAGGMKPLVELARDANKVIRDAMLKKGIDISRKMALWVTTAAVVRINKSTFDWLQIGDSLILTIMRDGSSQLFTKNYDHDIETMVMWKELADKQTKDIRGILNSQLLKVRSGININYGSLDGEKEAEKFLNYDTVPLAGVAHIILFTDGLILPNQDPSQPDDFKTFVDLFLDGGLKRIQEFVRKKENADPKCWKYPRSKTHDDIAAIALSL